MKRTVAIAVCALVLAAGCQGTRDTDNDGQYGNRLEPAPKSWTEYNACVEATGDDTMFGPCSSVKP